MSAVPALRDFAALDSNSAAATIAQLREAAEWVETANIGEARSIKERAAMVREWVKIRKLAAEIGAEALRTELTALRRLGELDALADLPVNERSAARGLAALSELDFARVLSIAGTSAVGVWRRFDRERFEQSQEGFGRQLGRGKAFNGSVHATDDLRDSARTILAAALDQGKPTSVAQAALALSEMLDADWRDPAIRRGLKEVVKDSLRSADNWPDDHEAPDWITYQDPDAGWVRIPFAVANVEQKQAWVEFRTAQAVLHLHAANRARRLVRGAS